MMRTRNRRRQQRRGAIVVLAALLAIVMLALVAFGLDMGYLVNARTELQRAADAAAIAGAWELIDREASGTPGDLTDEITLARQVAAQYAAMNPVCSSTPTVDPNSGNGATGDVVIGYLPNPSLPSETMLFGNISLYNAVQVTVHRSAERNGEVPLFFGRVLGKTGQGMSAQATAARLNNIGGFRIPATGENIGILPFALDKQTWDGLKNNQGEDKFTYDPSTGKSKPGGDGVLEVNLYPQGTGSPGNRGTVDIGSSNNSTADIARQILEGVNASDLAKMGGKIELNSEGELLLNGDTGISAGVKDELASIIGKPRVIPVFESVTGNGNNATYTVVEFVGVRIVEVNLTGKMSNKRVMVQPASVVVSGAIPASSGQTSTGVYSRVWLVR